jgi:hypothetical protein
MKEKTFTVFIRKAGDVWERMEIEGSNFRDVAKKLKHYNYKFIEAYISLRRYPYHIFGDYP